MPRPVTESPTGNGGDSGSSSDGSDGDDDNFGDIYKNVGENDVIADKLQENCEDNLDDDWGDGRIDSV